MAENIYEIVQRQIIERLEYALENGEKFQWVKPWSGGAPFPCSYTSPEKPFNSLVNLLFLENGEYITFAKIRQMQKDNPEIRLKKGSHAQKVFQIFPNFQKDREGEYVVDKEGNRIVESFSFRYVNEFNILDVEGLKPHYEIKQFSHTETDDTLRADKYIDAFCTLHGIHVKSCVGENIACYNPAENSVRLPDKSQFESLYEYYSTVFHEIAGHGTGKLCGRQMGGRSGSDAYAFEELVAEITAATACARFHIYDDRSQDNNVAYLQGWIQRIKEEPATLIKDACDQAAKAFEIFQQAYDTPSIYRQQLHEPLVRILRYTGSLKLPEEMPLSVANIQIPSMFRQKGTEIEVEIRYRMDGEDGAVRQFWHGGEKRGTLFEEWKSQLPDGLWNHLNDHMELSDTSRHYQIYFKYHRDSVPEEKANEYLEALGKYLERCREQIDLGNSCPKEIPLLKDFGIEETKNHEEIRQEERKHAHKGKQRAAR